MKQVKTAIIGCGKVGHFHAKALAKLPESEFVAVCGNNPERTREFARLYGVQAFDDVATMIESSGAEMASVCTPHPIHARTAVPAIRAGAAVLVEKPLAANLHDCDAIITAAEAAGVLVGTVVQRRLYRPCMRIRKAIEDGKLGRPVLGMVTMLGWRDEAYYKSDPWRGTWAGEGGGVLVNQAPHQIDLLHWYMGEVDEVYGVWRNLNHPYIEVDDTAVATIRFKNGGVGSIVVSNSQNPALYGRVHLHGANGASAGVQTDGGAMFIAGVSAISEAPYNDLWTVPGEEDMLDIWKREDSDFFHSVDSMHYYHELQIQDFLRAILEGRKPLVDGGEGRKTVEVIEAIYRSTETGLPVKFPMCR